MPVAREYKANREIIGGNITDYVVSAEDFERFVSEHVTTAAWVDNEPSIDWTPKYPAAKFGYFGSVSEEALYVSNFECIVEIFRDEIGVTLESGTDELFEFDASDSVAVALACYLDLRAEDYPVVDEDHYTQTKHDMILAGIDNGFRDDAIDAIDNTTELDGLFGRDVDPDGLGARLLESEIQDIAFTCVSYSGELYLESIARYLKDNFGQSVERYAATLRAILASERREIFETVQPPFTGIEV